MVDSPEKSYPAIITKDDDQFFVLFPDIPGCFSAGDTVEQAESYAVDALTQHLEALDAEGMEVNSPSKLDAVKLDDADLEEVSRVMITTETKVSIPKRVVTGVLTAFAEGVSWTDEQRTAYTELADAVGDRITSDNEE